jgi:hypothetical protein
MSKQSIFCIATSDIQANQIVDRLKAESFSDNEIAVVAAVDGMAAGLVGRGIPQMEAELYESKAKTGNILISVQTENVGRMARRWRSCCTTILAIATPTDGIRPRRMCSMPSPPARAVSSELSSAR